MAKLCPRCTQSSQIELHVVAQVVEAEFVVGAVGDVCGVGLAALLIVQIVDDHAHRQPEEAVELAHPLRVALGQIIVDRDHVHAAPAERIQIYREAWRPAFCLLRSSFPRSCRRAAPCRRSSCTSKCRMLSTRRPASRTTAKASTSISSRTSCSQLVASASSAFRAVEIGFGFFREVCSCVPGYAFGIRRSWRGAARPTASASPVRAH